MKSAFDLSQETWNFVNYLKTLQTNPICASNENFLRQMCRICFEIRFLSNTLLTWWCFRTHRKKYRRTKIDCFEDIADVVASSEVNVAPLVGRKCGPSWVLVHDWSGLLSKFFVKIEKIKSFHHFFFNNCSDDYRLNNILKRTQKQHLRRNPEPEAFPRPHLINPEGFIIPKDSVVSV